MFEAGCSIRKKSWQTRKAVTKRISCIFKHRLCNLYSCAQWVLLFNRIKGVAWFFFAKYYSCHKVSSVLQCSAVVLNECTILFCPFAKESNVKYAKETGGLGRFKFLKGNLCFIASCLLALHPTQRFPIHPIPLLAYAAAVRHPSQTAFFDIYAAISISCDWNLLACVNYAKNKGDFRFGFSWIALKDWIHYSAC